MHGSRKAAQFKSSKFKLLGASLIGPSRAFCGLCGAVRVQASVLPEQAPMPRQFHAVLSNTKHLDPRQQRRLGALAPRTLERLRHCRQRDESDRERRRRLPILGRWVDSVWR